MAWAVHLVKSLRPQISQKGGFTVCCPECINQILLFRDYTLNISFDLLPAGTGDCLVHRLFGPDLLLLPRLPGGEQV